MKPFHSRFDMFTPVGIKESVPREYYFFDTDGPVNTVFVIASNFKNIAIFKNKLLRNVKSDVAIVWYSECGDGLLRVSGNVHKYTCQVSNGKFDYRPKK